MKLIILSVTPYKEKDAIVNAISEEEIVTFTIRGGLDAKSKNIILVSPLIEADVTFQEGKSRYNIVKNSSLIASPYGISDSLDKMTVISAISEMCKSCLQDDEKHLLFLYLEKAIISLKEGSVDPLQVLVMIMSKILKISGFEFEMNKCVFCGSKKDIVSFSFEDGGFICKNCIDDSFERELNTNQMLLLRSLFLLDDFNIKSPYFNKKDILVIIDKLALFIEEGLGFKIKSLKLLYA